MMMMMMSADCTWPQYRPQHQVRLEMVRQIMTQSDRLVGLVVKASASKAEDPGFESRLRRDFFRVDSYQ